MKRVYFIRAIGIPDSPVKIGCSQSPQDRRYTFEKWVPYPLEVAAEIEGSFRLEGRFHAKFLGQHSHSEWFRPSDELNAVIDAINAGTFDPETLPAFVDLRWATGAYPTGPISEERKERRARQREARQQWRSRPKAAA